jgi:beta-alanine degradation protein BauB
MKKICVKVCGAALVGALPLAAWAQDPVKVDPLHYQILVDNASVRVLKVSLGTREKTPSHSHPDAILVPLSGGRLRFVAPDGNTQEVELKEETPVYTAAETHAGTNIGTVAIEAVLVELKSRTAAGAILPTARPGLSQTLLAEGPLAVAYRSSAASTFQEPAGSTHDFDQVVIALRPADFSLAVEGKPAKAKWQRGDVLFVGRGEKHQSRNTGGKPIDFIIVGVK